MAQSTSGGSEEPSPFENIIDDSDAREQSAEWAYGEIAGGRTVEEVAADLIANGWSHDDAGAIAEQARQRTRGHRGVITGQDARQAFGVGEPAVARNATPFASPGMFGAVGDLFRAISRLWSTKNVGRSNSQDRKR
jgi:hypothetical protein